ncbi:uncharacterized protein LOC129716165 [Leucoraja erinacea]|uniref:uncharacterized protein LOC129716165 n=1 Tax=Leucoraja erinaceus TaxID=7782 RepID=UPI0024543BB9|nr:uncharacterized protein LOC129716165 [Leucoraja erinacea]
MKLKRQHPLGWPEPDISPFSGQPLSLDQGLMPDLVKCHIHGHEHSSALCSEEMMGQRSLMEQPFSELLQPPSVQGNLETHPAGSCFHFQTSPSENHLDTHLGGFCQEHLVVPETPPPPFTDPRCGMGRVVPGDAPAPSYMEQLQNPPLSPTYSLTQAELSSLPEVRVRVGTRTTQDIHIYQNGWSSLQSGHCSGYMMITPLLDTYDAESPAYTQSCSHSLVG